MDSQKKYKKNLHNYLKMPKVTRETPLTGKTKSGKILSEQEELFCNMYVQELGNGVQAALEAYDIDRAKKGFKFTAGAIANENLKKPYILERIREILDLSELNDETVDTELNFLVKQSSDLHAKKGGIDIYNKIKGRYAKDNEQKQPQIMIKEINYIKPDELNNKTNP